jgi:hypothetical protein
LLDWYIEDLYQKAQIYLIHYKLVHEDVPTIYHQFSQKKLYIIKWSYVILELKGFINSLKVLFSRGNFSRSLTTIALSLQHTNFFLQNIICNKIYISVVKVNNAY